MMRPLSTSFKHIQRLIRLLFRSNFAQASSNSFRFSPAPALFDKNKFGLRLTAERAPDPLIGANRVCPPFGPRWIDARLWEPTSLALFVPMM